MNKAQLYEQLKSIIHADRLRLDEPMCNHTTFKVGGPVDFFVSPQSTQEIALILKACADAQMPYHVIGCGSDLLISDNGLNGVCICFDHNFAQIEVNDTQLIAQAGATNKEVARAAMDAGLSGYEFASGIPGSIGGAAIMNAGAYDGQFSDICINVTCLTPKGDIVEVSAKDADWGYRRSMMSNKGYIVLSATLQLVPWNKEQINARIEELTALREEKQPLELGSAGSTFKRPPGYYAGKLIDDAGMRGHTYGGAQVSNKHCGFVVNTGSATALDIRQVIKNVQDAVFADSGVFLEPEVRMWGFDDD